MPARRACSAARTWARKNFERRRRRARVFTGREPNRGDLYDSGPDARLARNRTARSPSSRRRAHGMVLDAGRLLRARRPCGAVQSSARQGPRDQRISRRRLRIEIRRYPGHCNRRAARQRIRSAGQADAARVATSIWRPEIVHAPNRKSAWAPTPRASWSRSISYSAAAAESVAARAAPVRSSWSTRAPTFALPKPMSI